MGARRTYAYPNRLDTPQFDYEKDFLFAVPKQEDTLNAPEGYPELRSLYYKHKGGQRRWLSSQGICTPDDYEPHEGKYIQRPFNHHSGRDYTVLDSAPDSVPEGYYAAPLFKKTHEYRILMVKGEPLITLLKRNPEDGAIPVDQPWNHANGSSFITVNNPENNRLRHTSVVADLHSNPTLNTAHILGVDVLYNHDDRSYAVCEVNFAPSITLENNLTTIKNHLQIGDEN
jgi:hypothetical protein